MTLQDRKQRIAETWHAAWDEGRVDVLDDLLSHDYVRHGRTSDQAHEAFKASIVSSRAAFPDLATTIEHIISEGDLVSVRWSSTGTHQGIFEDVPATHRSVVIHGVTTARFTGELIAEEWVTWDPVDLFTSLGIITLQDAG